MTHLWLIGWLILWVNLKFSVFTIDSPNGQFELNKLRSRQGSSDLRHLFREQGVSSLHVPTYTSNRSLSIDLANRRMKKVSISGVLPHINGLKWLINDESWLMNHILEDSEGSIHSERRISILSTRSESVYSSSKSSMKSMSHTITHRPSQIAQVAIIAPNRRYSHPEVRSDISEEEIEIYK